MVFSAPLGDALLLTLVYTRKAGNNIRSSLRLSASARCTGFDFGLPGAAETIRGFLCVFAPLRDALVLTLVYTRKAGNKIRLSLRLSASARCTGFDFGLPGAAETIRGFLCVFASPRDALVLTLVYTRKVGNKIRFSLRLCASARCTGFDFGLPGAAETIRGFLCVFAPLRDALVLTLVYSRKAGNKIRFSLRLCAMQDSAIVFWFLI